MSCHQHHHFLASLLRMVMAWAAVFGLHSMAMAAPRPNVLIILADDMGWGDLAINGNNDVATPHLDSLARDGIRFDRFFVCPVCSPTRAEFLTGRYHPRSGVSDTSRGGERMNADERTIADLFHTAGYATACFGKWHNGGNFPHHPNARGFDEFYGFCSGHWGDYVSPLLEHNGRLVQGEGFVADDFTNRANRYIGQQHAQGKPFFVFLAFNTPHSPMQVPDEYWAKFRDKDITQQADGRKRKSIDHTRAALALCENIDANVGRLLARLDELKIADDTLVLFFTDNGPNGNRWNDGMKGIKGSVDEGGVRSPLFVRWKDHLPKGKTIAPISAAIDLFPTLADIAGISPAKDKPWDGVSLKPLMLDSQKAEGTWPDRMIFSHWNGKVSVRDPHYRLDAEGRLFDMRQDPAQQHDVSSREVAKAMEMRSAAVAWRKSVLGNGGEDRRPLLVAHPDAAWSRLPADDAKPSGSIRRSSVHPNCSYFTDWTSVDDRISWGVEVMTAGNYEVEIHYACPASDIGSVVELSLGTHHITGKVSTAHDPPQRGRALERVPRTESYAKEFRTMKLGAMRLEKGPNTLVLRAIVIPGKQVMEFRCLSITRID